jgi:site-specific recombinase XerD
MTTVSHAVAVPEGPEGLVSLLAAELARKSGSVLAARNDAEAVVAWLDARASRSDATRRAYTRVARNFLLWMHERGIARLADLRVEDGTAYLLHLANPPSHWIRPARLAKDQPLLSTQVFLGPLSEKVVAWNRTVLVQLLGYLADSGYLGRNVMHLTARAKVPETPGLLKSFSLQDWGWLAGWLHRLPQTPENIRRCWMLEFLYHTGLRREEAAKAKFSDLERGDHGWMLKVEGKGRKVRLVTLNSALMRSMRAYRVAIDLTEFPLASEDGPIIERMRRAGGRRNMTPRQIGAIVRASLQSAAADCEDERTKKALLAASTHTMRHTNVSHRLAAGASLETTQDEVGHANIQTTRGYAHTELRKRREDAERLTTLYG